MTLRVGTTLCDEDGDEWLVREVGPGWVRIQHPERGIHRVQRKDITAWLERDRWTRCY